MQYCMCTPMRTNEGAEQYILSDLHSSASLTSTCWLLNQSVLHTLFWLEVLAMGSIFENPVDSCQQWADVGLATLLTLLKVDLLSKCMLFNARGVSSWCTGLGSDHILLEHFIKRAILRNRVLVAAGLNCSLETVLSCVAYCAD